MTMKKIEYNEATTEKMVIKLDSFVFRRLVIPGIIIEVLLALIICLPIDANMNLLTRSVGGPPGIAIQVGMIPCVILALAYLIVAVLYTIILPYKYYKGSTSFLSSVRRFSMFSVFVLLALDLIIIIGLVEFIRWNYVDILNIPVVAGFGSLSIIMTIVFLYWVVLLYKRMNIRFISVKTIESVILFIGVLMFVIGIFLILL